MSRWGVTQKDTIREKAVHEYVRQRQRSTEMRGTANCHTYTMTPSDQDVNSTDAAVLRR